MKKGIVFLLLFFTSNIVEAQVGINTTIPNAQLDIRSSNQASPSNTDGILIPKMNVFPAINPTAAQQGMLVYLTTTSGTDSPGFYYWDNGTIDWIPIGNNNSNSWTLSGNSGTNAVTNFIGTTDNNDLIFKRNNQTVGIINTDNLSFGYSNFLSGVTGIGNYLFGSANLENNSSGSYNNAFGLLALNRNTTGNNNVAIGPFGLFNTTTGSSNIGIGLSSGYSNTTGSGNISIGNLSAYNTTAGFSNVSIGSNSLNSNITGSGNVAIGENSDVANTNLTNATAIGSFAEVGASNSLILGSINGVNGATSSVNVGVGTTIPLDRLHVVGNIRMVDGNQAAGRVLTSDGNGTATWQNASANAWGLFGNNGTNPTTNFIGTTDNVDLVFRRFNTISGRIGTSNTFFGRLSGSVSTANNNTYIGTEAGRDNVSGQQNVFIGRRSGTFGTTGSDNILIGNGAGIFNEANQNVLIGSFSGNATSTGANNTFMGYSSGVATNVGSQNAFFGANAGTTNSTGIGNTIVGTNSNVAVNNLTNASAIGFNATVGASNSMVLGSINGVNSATSSVNVGIGTTTPQDRLHVVGNIRMADGNQAAGRVLTSDANGTATWQNASANAWGLVGNAGTNAATNFIGTTDNIDLVFRRGNIISGRLGDTNTYFGRNSGVVNTGTSNTFIGERTGIANASGNFNTFIGRLAGANGASGNENTYLGYAAGLSNTGSGNLILGSFASQNTSGNFNVFVGFNAGSTNTTGTRNTTIGVQSDVGSANLTNATAIGNLAQVDASNSLVLGSINGVNGSLVSTNVGIGTTSPATRLEILDENNVTSNTNRGNLHVMANNPQAIDIGGSITLGGYFDDLASVMRVFGSVEGRKSNITNGNSSGYLQFKTNNGGTLTERMRINNIGFVGIGIANPNGQFELSLDQGRKPGTGTWTIVSDQRLKIINGKYTKGLNEILQLNPIRFNYKNNGERTFEKEVLETEFPGFIAQEVQPLFPDAIGTDADGFLNFNMHPILIASVNAIKELNAKNTQLQSENQSLKTELDQQKALLESVLQRIAQLEQK